MIYCAVVGGYEIMLVIILGLGYNDGCVMCYLWVLGKKNCEMELKMWYWLL